MKLTRNDSLQTWIDWLLSIHPEEIDLGLDRIRQVANTLGLFDKPRPFVISVAGTNGKGSSVAMLSAIYQAADYQVGCYTSPHILSFNERFQINGGCVSDVEITTAFEKIEQARIETNNIKLTYFEFSTLAALVIFSQYNLDIILLEVGLGGRLDAVNIIDADATLITAIDIDHVDWLGSDREIIGIEKAGIMREEKLSIIADYSAPSSVRKHATKNNVDFLEAGTDFSYEIDQTRKLTGWHFRADSERLKTFTNLPFPSLLGDFQVQNATGVIALISICPYQVSEQNIKTGLQNIRHDGRLQSLRINDSNWLIDVAHNVQSMAVLADYLQNDNFNGIAIFSVLDDKDYVNMIAKLTPFINTWYIADLDVPRASSLDTIENTLLKSGVNKSIIHRFPSIEDATKCVLEENKSQVLVTGSFFTVSQCYNSLNKSGVNTKGKQGEL